MLWCWMLLWVYPWFFELLVVEIYPNFITWHNSMQKNFFLFCLRFEINKWFSMACSFNWYETYFPSFWLFPKCRGSEIVDWAIFNASVNYFNIWVMSSLNNACKPTYSHFLGWFGKFLSFTPKSPFFKHLNHCSQVFWIKC